MHQDFGIGTGLPVVQTQNDIDCADHIGRAHQFEFFVFRKIAQMDRAELPKYDVHADGLRILCIVFSGPEIRAVRIRFAAAGNRRFNRLTGRSDDARIEPRHRNPVSRFGDDMLRSRIELRIHLLEKVIRGLPGLYIGTVINEFSDRNV